MINYRERQHAQTASTPPPTGRYPGRRLHPALRRGVESPAPAGDRRGGHAPGDVDHGPLPRLPLSGGRTRRIGRAPRRRPVARLMDSVAPSLRLGPLRHRGGDPRVPHDASATQLGTPHGGVALRRLPARHRPALRLDRIRDGMGLVRAEAGAGGGPPARRPPHPLGTRRQDLRGRGPGSERLLLRQPLPPHRHSARDGRRPLAAHLTSRPPHPVATAPSPVGLDRGVAPCRDRLARTAWPRRGSARPAGDDAPQPRHGVVAAILGTTSAPGAVAWRTRDGGDCRPDSALHAATARGGVGTEPC